MSLTKRANQGFSVLQKLLFILCIIAALVSAFFSLRVILSYVTWPYPIEYRDSSALDAAIAMHKGVNIYSTEVFPDYIYLYGAVHAGLISLALNFFPPSMTIAYIIDLFFVIGVLLLFFIIFKRLIKNKSFLAFWYIITASSLLFFYVQYVKISGARPSPAGMFFMLAGLIFIQHDPDSIKMQVLSWIFFLLAYNSKTYFVIGFPIAGLYLLLFSPKKGLRYLILGGLGYYLFYVIISRFYPLFFNYTLFAHFNNTDYYALNQLWKQLIVLLTWLILPFSLVGAGCLDYCRFLFSNRKTKIHEVILRSTRESESVMFYIGFFLNLIYFLVRMGGCYGNYLCYFIDLTLPFLLVCAGVCLVKCMNSTASFFNMLITGQLVCLTVIFLSRTYPDQTYLVYGKYVVVLAAIYLVLLVIMLCSKNNWNQMVTLIIPVVIIMYFFGINYFTKYWEPNNFVHETTGYEELFLALDACESVYLTPMAYPYTLQSSSVTDYDNGFTEYSYNSYYPRKLKPFSFLFESPIPIDEMISDYREEVQSKFTDEIYDCVALTSIDYVNSWLPPSYHPVETYSKGITTAITLYKQGSGS